MILNDRIYLPSYKEKKLVVNAFVRKISVTFNKETQTHRVDVEFHNPDARLIEDNGDNPLTEEAFQGSALTVPEALSGLAG